MKLKKFIVGSLFLAIGLLLHQVTPPIFFGMKPDFLLTMMFIAIILTDDYKTTLTLGIAAGILTAITTSFPGGQIPNLIDKLLTCNFVYIIFKLLKDKVDMRIIIGIISVLATLFSGTVFLSSAYLLFGLPAPFTALLLTVVIPASIINTVVAIILYSSISIALKHSSLDL